VKSITAPVVHDGQEHIEYVPTQVLTEFFRQHVTALDGSALDGIVYPSARRRRGKSLVVLRSQEDLDPATLSGQEPLLKLDSSSVKRLRRPSRKAP
jgi:RES domain